MKTAPEKLAAVRRYYATPKGHACKRRARASRYGLTLDQYDALYAESDGLCELCHRPETVMRKGALCRLSIDHCHRTGTVRGLLCNNCNRGIGLLGDDAEMLERAAVYVAAGGFV